MDDEDHFVNKFTWKPMYLIEKVFPEEPIRKTKHSCKKSEYSAVVQKVIDKTAANRSISLTPKLETHSENLLNYFRNCS